MNQLYKVVGISKQATNQYARRQKIFDIRVDDLVAEAEDLRLAHPGCGVEKMYRTLAPDFIGRDRFVELMMEAGFRLKKSKNYRRTTYSVCSNYPNLIKGMYINSPSMVWQSDITYIQVGGRFYYAVFIIDVYTRKIVGYQVSNHMRGTANVKALEMALKKNKAPWIHHSDRGSQYIYKEYIELLKEKGCQISMALSAQDNAYAERINRTIKEEYLDYWKPDTFEQLQKDVAKAVNNYNKIRLHNNRCKLSPVCFENKHLNNELVKNTGFTIFDNENIF